MVTDAVAELATGRELDLCTDELPAAVLAEAFVTGTGPLRRRRATVSNSVSQNPRSHIAS